MRHGLILFCATLLWFGASVRAKSLTFYVATNGNDHWSGRLEEPARDGKDGPLASLPAALEKTRAARQDSAKTPDRISILLRGGTYSVAQPVVLVPEDSGSDVDHPFTIAAFPNENPVLSGGRRISGWRKVEGKSGLWQTAIPEARDGKWYFRQLVINGQRKQRGRAPNAGS